MPHRPYPNTNRALRQLDRHTMPAREMTAAEQRITAQVQAIHDAVQRTFSPLLAEFGRGITRAASRISG